MRITDLYFSGWLRPGKTRTLAVGGFNRTYLVHVPEGHRQKTPLPVVLALHGATMNGPMMAWFSGLNRKAGEAGFIVVYPNGTGARSSFFWNGGNCCGSAMRNNVDDVAFINALLDDLMRADPVDAQRVYATGMSTLANGPSAVSTGSPLNFRIASPPLPRWPAPWELRSANRNVRCRSCISTARRTSTFHSWAAEGKKASPAPIFVPSMTRSGRG